MYEFWIVTKNVKRTSTNKNVIIIVMPIPFRRLYKNNNNNIMLLNSKLSKTIRIRQNRILYNTI